MAECDILIYFSENVSPHSLNGIDIINIIIDSIFSNTYN